MTSKTNPTLPKLPTLQEEHAQCAFEFAMLYKTEDGNSIGCDIWRAMVGEEELFDNCIGENFNQLFHTIRDDWFGQPAFGKTSRVFYNTSYLMWLYLVVSRAYEVFDSINPKGTNELVERKRLSLTTFSEINLWAKFIKHPKEFMFCHWPEASCEGQMHSRNRSTSVVVNTAYLKTHYTTEKDKRPIELRNNTEVVVQYPNLIRITKGFVQDFMTFRDFVCKNEMVIEELRKHTNVPIEMTLPLMPRSEGES